MKTTTARLLDLWPKLKAPVWMTPFTAGLLEAKRQQDAANLKLPINIFRAGEKFMVGPFGIEAIAVTHSIPEPVSLAITTPLGTVIHTADWKIDPAPEIGPMTNEARFREIGQAGVLALICDSTNALRDGEFAVGAGGGAGAARRHPDSTRAALPSPPFRRMSGASARSPKRREIAAGSACCSAGR